MTYATMNRNFNSGTSPLIGIAAVAAAAVTLSIAVWLPTQLAPTQARMQAPVVAAAPAALMTVVTAPDATKALGANAAPGQLPGRAIQSAVVTVTFGSKITGLWWLNDHKSSLQMPRFMRTERPLYSARYGCATRFSREYQGQSTGTLETTRTPQN